MCTKQPQVIFTASVENYDERFRQGLRNAERENYEAAVSDFSVAIALALFNRAEALRRLIRTEEAIADLTLALAINPLYVQARLQLGRCNYEAGHYPQAIDHVRRYLSRQNFDVDAWSLLGDAQRLHGDLDGAQRSLETAYKLSRGKNIDAVAGLAQLRWQRRDPSSIVAMTEALRLAPEDSWLYAQRGGAFRALGRVDLALADANAALACEDAQRWAYVLRGNCHLRNGDFTRAIADFRKVKKTDMDFGYALAFIGETHRRRGHLRRAVAAFDAALAVPDDDSATYARSHRAAALQALGDAASAKAEAERALAACDADDDWSRADALVVLGRTDEAVTALTRAFAEKWTQALLAEGEDLLRPLLADPRLAAAVADAKARAAQFDIPAALYRAGAPVVG